MSSLRYQILSMENSLTNHKILGKEHLKNRNLSRVTVWLCAKNGKNSTFQRNKISFQF